MIQIAAKLQWRNLPREGMPADRWVADSVAGRYVVFLTESAVEWGLVLRTNNHSAESVRAAMEAAQADLEGRIRASLTPEAQARLEAIETWLFT